MQEACAPSSGWALDTSSFSQITQGLEPELYSLRGRKENRDSSVPKKGERSGEKPELVMGEKQVPCLTRLGEWGAVV